MNCTGLIEVGVVIYVPIGLVSNGGLMAVMDCFMVLTVQFIVRYLHQMNCTCLRHVCCLGCSYNKGISCLRLDPEDILRVSHSLVFGLALWLLQKLDFGILQDYLS